jgi:hypothetical protein
MTANRVAVAALIVGLLIVVGGMLGFQLFAGQQDFPILVLIAVAQLAAILVAAGNVRHGRSWLVVIGLAELAASLLWVAFLPHTGGRAPSPGTASELPFGGRWSLLGLLTGMLTVGSGFLMRPSIPDRRLD